MSLGYKDLKQNLCNNSSAYSHTTFLGRLPRKVGHRTEKNVAVSFCEVRVKNLKNDSRGFFQDLMNFSQVHVQLESLLTWRFHLTRQEILVKKPQIFQISSISVCFLINEMKSKGVALSPLMYVQITRKELLGSRDDRITFSEEEEKLYSPRRNEKLVGWETKVPLYVQLVKPQPPRMPTSDLGENIV